MLSDIANKDQMTSCFVYRSNVAQMTTL